MGLTSLVSGGGWTATVTFDGRLGLPRPLSTALFRPVLPGDTATLTVILPATDVLP
ncbi:MAG TPA: hypothetical protein VI542_39250 [Candidatus Tectomicrobia bacterium]